MNNENEEDLKYTFFDLANKLRIETYEVSSKLMRFGYYFGPNKMFNKVEFESFLKLLREERK